MERRGSILRPVLIATACFALCVGVALAQVKTESTTTAVATRDEVKVERGEVMFIKGTDLILKMENGETRYLSGVSETARATVDGKEIGIHDVKVGMKLEKTTITTTNEELVTTVDTVTGTVVHALPPRSVTLRMENGEIKTFKIPKDQMFDIDGRKTDAFGLKEGQRIKATRIVKMPRGSVTEKASVTGAMPADTAVLIEDKSAPAEAQQLPKTAGPLPLVGLAGMVALGLSLALTAIRRSR